MVRARSSDAWMGATSMARMRAVGGPILWGLLSAGLFGASTPASKRLLAELGPVLLSGVLYAGAALAVAPWALRDFRARSRSDLPNRLRLGGAILFGGLVGPVVLLFGLRAAPAGSVALWLNLETVATAVLARLFFREYLGPRAWVAVALVIAASALITPFGGPGIAPVALVALACSAWGLDNNLTAIIDAFTPAQITFAKGLCAAAVNLCLGLWLEPFPCAPGAVAAGVCVGALSYGASLLLYVASAQHLGATRSQLIFSTAPLFGLLLAWIFLDEPLGSLHLWSAALMMLALWIWQRERHAHPHTHPGQTHRHWHRHDDGDHHAHAHASPVVAGRWHCHTHAHAALTHHHPHRPDLHHRHAH